jgi:predicted nucleic acid-binding protein
VILVDSSIWIGFQRVGFYDLLGGEEPVVCLPIIQEVLQGIRSERQYRETLDTFRAMTILEAPMSIELYEHAALIFRTARTVGYTIRSAADCLIAACAIRNAVPVLHHDRDFAVIARVTTLEHRNLAN